MRAVLRAGVPALLGVVAGACFSWGWANLHASPISEPQSSALPVVEVTPVQGPSGSESAHLKRRLDALKARIEELEQRPGPEQASTPSSPAADDGPAGETPLERAWKERAAVERRQQRLEDTMRSEPRDAGWSSRMQSDLQSVLQDPLFAGTALEGPVSCTSSLCRADVQHASPEAQESFEQNFHLKKPKSSGGFTRTRTDEHGTLVTTVYLAREGASHVLMTPLSELAQQR